MFLRARFACGPPQGTDGRGPETVRFFVFRSLIRRFETTRRGGSRALMEGFTADQASRFTGCTAHQLRYWDRIGLVKPTVQSTGGRPGVRRLYSFRDLISLRCVRSLLDGGMSLQRVRRAFEYLRKKAGLEDHLSGVKLVTDGASIFKICRNDGEILDALKEGQMAFFLAIDEVARSVDMRVAEYLYDREEFISALKRVEVVVESELPEEAVRRVHAEAG
jgi:DNA-binding transcriptional MerR regulator